MKDERAYLLHAIEAVDVVLSYTADGREAFFSDRKTQDAVIRNIEIIGQAVNLRGSPMTPVRLSQRCRGAKSPASLIAPCLSSYLRGHGKGRPAKVALRGIEGGAGTCCKGTLGGLGSDLP